MGTDDPGAGGGEVSSSGEKLHLGDIVKGTVFLPCGYIDADGKLHEEVELREMTGDEEDILAMPNVSGSVKMSRIIGNCLSRIGTITKTELLQQIPPKLTIGDRTVLLLALRAVSLGVIYTFSIKCPECRKHFNTGLRLDRLEVIPMVDRMQREIVMTLPSGKTCVVRVMTGEDEDRLEQMRLGTTNRKDALSLAILARLKSLEGQEKPGLRGVKTLSLRDRHTIRNWYRKMEGGVETDVDVACTECGHEFKTTLDIGQPAFFFPGDSEMEAEFPMP